MPETPSSPEDARRTLAGPVRLTRLGMVAERATRARVRAERRFLAEHMVSATLDVYREAWQERHQAARLAVRAA